MLEARVLDSTYKSEYDNMVRHPVQSWAWGDFKKNSGADVERIGIFEDGRMIDALQIVFSKLPKLNLTIGYSARCSLKYAEIFPLMKELAKKHKAIFIKTEPNVFRVIDAEKAEPANDKDFNDIKALLLKNAAKEGKALFYRYDFHLALDKSEEQLMKSFHSKTRYNTRLAERKGVTVIENTSEKGMKNYLRLMKETTARQGFYNHNERYFLDLLKFFPKERIHILEARYDNKVLTTWILYNFNGRLYYPYGASSNEDRNVMPNNLVMWKAIQYGLKHDCKCFELWGCLGPNPDSTDSWYGFHKFKAGYNPQLVEYVGTYDFIYKPLLYKLFTIADKLRWFILKLRH